MSLTPYPWQEKDQEVLAAQGYVGLANIQTGGGKSLLGSLAMHRSNASVSLVVCPTQTMVNSWIPTVEDVTGRPPREIGNNVKAKREALSAFEWGVPGVYLVTPQLFARMSTDISGWSGDMLIVDESHQVSTPGSSGQRRLSGMTAPEAEKAMCLRFPGRIMLSGTPLRNRFDLAWSYGRALWPEQSGRSEIGYDNYWVWRQDRMSSEKVWVKKPGPDGELVASQVTVFTGEKDPGLWISQAPCVVTHLKRENCCEFHPRGFLPLDKPLVRHETIPLLPAQKKAIRELETTLVTWLEEHPLVTEIPLTRDQRIRQCVLGVPRVDAEGNVDFAEDTPSPFLDRLIEILRDSLEGETCVVWTDSRKFADVTTQRLNREGIPAFEYSGQTRANRDDELKRFGRDYRVMVGVLAAGSSGLDSLQSICKNEVWLNTSLDGVLNEQAEGRLDRMGQNQQVMRWFFHDDLGLSEGRYSEAVMKRLALNRSLRKA